MKVKKIVIEAEESETTKADDAEVKVEEAKTEEVKTEEVQAKAETEEPVAEAKAEEKTETTEVKTEEVAVEAKAEEEKSEKPEEPAKEVADTAETKKSDDTEVVVKLDFSDFKEQFEKMVSPLIETVNTLATKVDGLAKAAPTEGAADAEETPKEVAEKSEKTEEAPKEEVKKSDTSSEGASESELKLMEMIKGLKDGLEARLTKIESQPAPSKVVVTKVQGEEIATETTDLQKVTDRLGEIEKTRDADPAAYMRNTTLVDEALTLIAEKRRLMGGK